MRASNITRRLLVVGVGAALGLAGCGGGGTSQQAAPRQSTAGEPTSNQAKASGIPSSGNKQKAYFVRIYCVGDSQTQCKCKFESMGGNDASTFGAVLYKLKHNDDATVIRFGRASTGCV